MCNAMIGFHVLKWCDLNSALLGLRKKKCILIIRRAKSIKVAVDSLEKKLSTVCHAYEAFIRAVYTTVKVAGTKVNNVRYWMFCQKGHINENLPPILQQHYGAKKISGS